MLETETLKQGKDLHIFDEKIDAKAVEQGALWIVYGNESVFQETPTELQLDPDAMLYPPPQNLAAIDLLPGNLLDAWSDEAELSTTVIVIPGKLVHFCSGGNISKLHL